MKEMGYAPSDPEDLVESRDHGVTRGFIQRVKHRGYGKPSIDEVIRLRDRGLD